MMSTIGNDETSFVENVDLVVAEVEAVVAIAIVQIAVEKIVPEVTGKTGKFSIAITILMQFSL